MKMSDAFPSKYLKADVDVPEEGIVVTIKDIDFEMIGDERKVVMSFKGMEKTLVMNKTNAKMLEYLTKSDDMDDWIGLRITLYADDTQFGGEPKRGIRIKSKLPANPKKPTPAPVEDDSEEPIPF